MSLSHRRSPASMRAFYDWFSRFYPLVERNIGPILEDVASRWIAPLPGTASQTAIMEWIEGSYYDRFIRLDFRDIAARSGARSVEEGETDQAMVLHFFKNR